MSWAKIKSQSHRFSFCSVPTEPLCAPRRKKQKEKRKSGEKGLKCVWDPYNHHELTRGFIFYKGLPEKHFAT